MLPLRRISDQTGFDRVLLDVIDDVLKMMLVSDVAIEVVIIPKLPPPAEHPIGLFRGVGSPGMEYPPERMARDHFDQAVNMIGHDAPGQQVVALAIKMQQCVLDQFGDSGIAQEASSVASVLVGFDTPSQGHGLRIVLIEVFVPAELATPFLDKWDGHGVEQTKIEALNLIVAVEMRKVASAMPTLVWSLQRV